jgi:putative component of membrane protein insertase Oxa1/YidC/SpoIIIJ protein YidD
MLMGGAIRAAFSTSTNYYPVFCAYGTGSYLTESAMQAVITHSCRIHKLAVTLETGPAAGKSWTFTLMKNGVATSLTCTVSNPDSTASDLTHYVDLVAGDYVSMKKETSGSPATTCGYWTLALSPVTADEHWYGSLTMNVPAATNYWCGLSGGPLRSGEYNPTIFPCAGTLSKMYVKCSVAPGAGATRTIKVYKNGGAPAGTLSVALGAADLTGSDLANSVTVAAGDYLEFYETYSGAPPASAISHSCKFVPTTSGYHVIGNGSNGYNLDAANTKFWPVNHCDPGADNGGAARTNYENRSRTTTLKNLYVKLNASPGAGKSYKFTVYNGANPTGLTVTISDAATTGNVSSDVSVTDGDLLSMEVVPTSTPTVRFASWGITAVE